MRLRVLKLRLFPLVAPFLLPLVATPIFAQTSTATVHGQVTDPSGAAVTDVSIMAVPAAGQPGEPKAGVVSKDGSYQIKGLNPGQYTVSAVAKGFTAFEQKNVAVAAGQNQTLDIHLEIEQQLQQVTVQSEANTLSVNPENNASATVIKGKDLDALSDDPDELQAELEALAGPSAGPNGGQIYIDGFTGGQLPPKADILEVRVNQNPFSAEYDKLGYGRIEITTRPGTSQFHGQVSVNGNDSALNSRNPFVTEEPAYHSEFFDGNLGGPLSKKASFFVDFFRRDINGASIVTAVVLDPSLTAQAPLNESVLNPQTRTNFSPRFDYQISTNNVLTVRYQLWEDSAKNDGIGQFSLPSQAYNTNGTEHTLQLNDTQVISARTVNQTRFQYLHDSNNDVAQDPTDPTLSVIGAFTGGGNSLVKSADTQDHYELQNLTSMALGNHSIVYGFRARDEEESNLSEGNFNGTYTFSSLDAYQMAAQALAACMAAGQVGCAVSGASQFSLTEGIPLAKVNLFDIGLYGQDDWRLRPNMTLSLGLRWESQDHIRDRSDFAPRIGFAWGIGHAKTTKTVLRAGVGTFYDRFQIGQLIEAEHLNGVNQHQFLVNEPDFYPAIPPVSGLVGGLTSPTTYQLDPNLRAPYTIQSAIGLERQVTKAITTSVTYLNSHGVHQLLTNNVNAPLPGTYNPADPTSGVRPFGDIGNIYQYESNGLFNESQLIVNFNIRAGSKLSLFGFYTLSYANGDSNGVSSFPSNPYDLLEDYGPAAFVVRNQTFVGGSYTLPHGFRVSPFLVATSGHPFNITVGQNLNGDSIFNQRPAFAMPGASGPNIVATRLGTFNILPLPGEPVIPPNYGVGPGQFALNLHVSKTFAFGKKPERAGGNMGGGGPRGGGGGRGGGLGGRGLSGGGGGPNIFGGDETGRYNLTFSLGVHNVFNNVNLGTPVGNLSSPIFGQSNSLAGGFFSSQSANRRIDMEARFSF